MNKPYVKQFDENGVLLNPVTKSNPYFSPYPNRRQRRLARKYVQSNSRSPYKLKRSGNNRKKTTGRKSIIKTLKRILKS